MFPNPDPLNDTLTGIFEPANFKYRFYECMPAECENEADEAVFAAGACVRRLASAFHSGYLRSKEHKHIKAFDLQKKTQTVIRHSVVQLVHYLNLYSHVGQRA